MYVVAASSLVRKSSKQKQINATRLTVTGACGLDKFNLGSQMRHFNPIRASSPAKSLSSSTATLSESRSAIAPELLHLSNEDVDILDAIIARAGHSATTFFTVFKAYSDVLVERGLHPQEVVYYGKLLKLGTLKGKNWGEKWKIVKAQLDAVSPI